MTPGGHHRDGSRGVHVRSLREGVDTSTPTGRAVTSIMATIAELELELELGKERRAASRDARVARGRAATKPMKLDAAQQKRLLRLDQQVEPVGELTTMLGVSRSTLFRTVQRLSVLVALVTTAAGAVPADGRGGQPASHITTCGLFNAFR